MATLVIVEVEGYDGEDGSIVVQNHRADRSGMGRPNTLYCIGELDGDGVVRLDDWGYATLNEAREAIGLRTAPPTRAD
ncbi:MAG TPA: hypothetical protein VE967_15915 [Gemmatimonadaceae bacterium]|nr:hypothetical protein [Gemmatimonadaceae bacterium]